MHGECGGYMALGEGLIDADGTRHRMAGLLGLVTSYEKRRMHLGYRRATLHAPIGGIAAATTHMATASGTDHSRTTAHAPTNSTRQTVISAK